MNRKSGSKKGHRKIPKASLQQHKLARLYIDQIYKKGGKVKSKKELLRKADYSEGTKALQVYSTSGFREALCVELENAGITDIRVAKKLNKFLNSKNEYIGLNSLKEVLKIKGQYAPKEIDQKVTANINVTQDQGDYANYLKERVQERDYQ